MLQDLRVRSLNVVFSHYKTCFMVTKTTWLPQTTKKELTMNVSIQLVSPASGKLWASERLTDRRRLSGSALFLFATFKAAKNRIALKRGRALVFSDRGGGKLHCDGSRTGEHWSSNKHAKCNLSHLVSFRVSIELVSSACEKQDNNISNIIECQVHCLFPFN